MYHGCVGTWFALLQSIATWEVKCGELDCTYPNTLPPTHRVQGFREAPRHHSGVGRIQSKMEEAEVGVP